MFARNGQKCAMRAKSTLQILDFSVIRRYTSMRRCLPGSCSWMALDRQPHAQIRALICVLFSTERWGFDAVRVGADAWPTGWCPFGIKKLKTVHFTKMPTNIHYKYNIYAGWWQYYFLLLWRYQVLVLGIGYVGVILWKSGIYGLF